ncbi:hypothetical protein NBRC116494_23540 [Aurantivibrio plasticivorans]
MKPFDGIKKLSLYHFQSCPFCASTRSVIKKTGLSIEHRDIQKNQSHWADLVENGGKSQVPALRIEREFEPTQWMYESGDINEFLTLYAQEIQHKKTA